MSTIFFLVFFGFIAYRIITSVMGPGFDVSEEARKKLEARRQAASPQQRGAPGRTPSLRTSLPAAKGGSSQPRQPALSRTSSVVARQEDELGWYIVLDVPPDASKREILEAVKRRLEVASASGDTTAPARVARAAATGMKQSPSFADAHGRRQ
ncbi:MAG TPA: hypothetical protein VNQ32_16130 [Steroidobacteraceae bacterium]|nr:hypothetical protein [Steroidobacteraceae bacterium]